MIRCLARRCRFRETFLINPPRLVVRLLSGKTSVLSLDSVYRYERATSRNARCTLLKHDTQSALGGSHGVHSMLLSSPAMHALRPAWRHPSGPSWSRSRYSSAAVHQV